MPHTPKVPRTSDPLDYFSYQRRPSEPRPRLWPNSPRTPTTSISSVFDPDPDSIGIASSSSVSLLLPPPSPQQAQSLRKHRLTPRNQTPPPRPRIENPFVPPPESIVGKQEKTRRRKQVVMKSSGDYTSPPILYCRKSSKEEDNDNNRFRFHFPDSPPEHKHKRKHDTWPPPPLPYAAQISQYIQHGNEDGVEDMWSEMRARILMKVDIHKRERKGDEEEGAWGRGGMDMRDVKGWIECESGEEN
jgi:hypothetical protein